MRNNGNAGRQAASDCHASKLNPSLVSGTRALVSTLSWFLIDALWRTRGATAIIIILGLFSAALKIGAMGMIIFFVQSLASGASETATAISVVAQPGVNVLVYVGLGSVTALILAAWVEYRTRLWAVGLAFNHEDFCLRRMLKLIVRLTAFPSQIKSFADPRKEIQKSLMMNVRLMGRAYRQILLIPQSLVLFLMAGGALFYLHWQLTVLLLVMLIPGIIFTVKINKIGMDAMANLNSAISQSQTVVQGIYRDYLTLNQPRHALTRRIRELVKDKRYLEAKSVRKKQMLVGDSAKLVSESVTAIMLLVIVLFYAAKQGGAEGWGAMVGYIIAARWALSSFQQIMVSGVSVGKFVPAMHGYRRILDILTETRGLARQELSWKERRELFKLNKIPLIPLGKPELKSNTKSLILSRGSPILFVSGETLDHFNIMNLFGHFRLSVNVGYALSVDTFIVNERISPSRQITLADLFCVDEVDGKRIIAEELTVLGYADSGESISDNLGSSAAECWHQWSFAFRMTCMAIAAKRSNKQIIFFTQDAVRRLKVDLVSRIIEYLAGKLLVVALYPCDASRFADTGFDQIAVVSAEGVLGLGDWVWFRDNTERIEAMELRELRRDLDMTVEDESMIME